MSPLAVVALTTAYACGISVAGPALLAWVRRTAARAPRAGLAMVAGIATSWLAALVSTGLLLVAETTDGLGIAALVEACVATACTVFGSPRDPYLPAVLALALPVTLLARLAWVGIGLRYDGWRRHARQRAMLGTVATRRRVAGGGVVWLLPVPTPAAYCTPGLRRRVVLTQGALDALDTEELAAVVAHERAHLRQCHYALLGWVRTLDLAFPGVPALRSSAALAAELVEWAADDSAARGRDRHAVARAIAAMAPLTGSALAASGGEVVGRVRRLLDPERRRHLAGRVAVCAGTAGALALMAIAPIASSSFGLSCGVL